MRKINISIKTKALLTVFLAALLWFVIFILKPTNFWLSLCIGIIILNASAILINRRLLDFGRIKLRHIFVGLLSAAVLYVIFYLGNIISGYIFPFKDFEINSVYSNKSGVNSYLISALLIFIIGPGEEIYWRAFIQKALEEKFQNKAFIVSSLLYAGVHILTGNFMLVLASLVCGIFWGYLYQREKSIYPVIISHAAWDLTVFMLLPF